MQFQCAEGVLQKWFHSPQHPLFANATREQDPGSIPSQAYDRPLGENIINLREVASDGTTVGAAPSFDPSLLGENSPKASSSTFISPPLLFTKLGKLHQPVAFALPLTRVLPLSGEMSSSVTPDIHLFICLSNLIPYFSQPLGLSQSSFE